MGEGGGYIFLFWLTNFFTLQKTWDIETLFIFCGNGYVCVESDNIIASYILQDKERDTFFKLNSIFKFARGGGGVVGSKFDVSKRSFHSNQDFSSFRGFVVLKHVQCNCTYTLLQCLMCRIDIPRYT